MLLEVSANLNESVIGITPAAKQNQEGTRAAMRPPQIILLPSAASSISAAGASWEITAWLIYLFS